MVHPLPRDFAPAPPDKRHTWENSEVVLLDEMWAAGEKLSVIATVVGHTEAAVNKMRMRRGLPARKRHSAWTAEEERTLRYMWEAGENVKAIAEMVGKSSKSVKQKRVAFGLKPRQGKKCKINIFLEWKMLVELDMRAAKNKMSRGRYLRRLIERDTERWEEWAKLKERTK